MLLLLYFLFSSPVWRENESVTHLTQKRGERNDSRFQVSTSVNQLARAYAKSINNCVYEAERGGGKTKQNNVKHKRTCIFLVFHFERDIFPTKTKMKRVTTGEMREKMKITICAVLRLFDAFFARLLERVRMTA